MVNFLQMGNTEWLERETEYHCHALPAGIESEIPHFRVLIRRLPRCLGLFPETGG